FVTVKRDRLISTASRARNGIWPDKSISIQTILLLYLLYIRLPKTNNILSPYVNISRFLLREVSPSTLIQVRPSVERSRCITSPLASYGISVSGGSLITA